MKTWHWIAILGGLTTGAFILGGKKEKEKALPRQNNAGNAPPTPTSNVAAANAEAANAAAANATQTNKAVRANNAVNAAANVVAAQTQTLATPPIPDAVSLAALAQIGLALNQGMTAHIQDPEVTKLSTLYRDNLETLLRVQRAWPGLKALHDYLQAHGVVMILDPGFEGILGDGSPGHPYHESDADKEMFKGGGAVRFKPEMFGQLSPAAYREKTPPAPLDAHRVLLDTNGIWFIWTGTTYEPVPIWRKDLNTSPIVTWRKNIESTPMPQKLFFDIGAARGDSPRVLREVVTTNEAGDPVHNPSSPSGHIHFITGGPFGREFMKNTFPERITSRGGR